MQWERADETSVNWWISVLICEHRERRNTGTGWSWWNWDRNHYCCSAGWKSTDRWSDHRGNFYIKYKCTDRGESSAWCKSRRWSDQWLFNMTGLLKIRTTKEFGESTVSKILELVENSSSRKSKSENFISKFAKYYTPAVCYGAIALALIPPIVLLIMGKPAMWGDWIYRALTFLVISCPCALVWVFRWHFSQESERVLKKESCLRAELRWGASECKSSCNG